MKPKIIKDSIFISIASYRDPVCKETVKSIFENAAYPNKIFLGICQQNKPDEDEDCKINNENNPNIKIIRIPHFEAKGPTWARYLCSTLWNGEEYFMQIDSHTKFIKNWDIKCIKMIKDIINSSASKKPILSHYPRELTDLNSYNEKNQYQVPRICQSFWNNRGMLSFLAAETIDTKNKSYQTPYIAGGMIFGPSEYLLEVPYDPNLPYLFIGEEILHSIRSFTYGWDVFTPIENIIFHEYTRKDKVKIWTDNPTYSNLNAFEKVKYYIGLVDKQKLNSEMLNNLDKYGLGKQRTLEDFYKYAGIDKDNKIVSKNFCRPDNKATEKDIQQSNEKNHSKENFTIKIKSNSSFFKLLIVLLIIIFLILIFKN